MRILVIGGVAAGTKAAAKLMREDRNNKVTLINKGDHISYAGCGLPYYVGHVIEDKASLIVNTAKSYGKLTGVNVIENTEAVKVDRQAKIVTAVDCKSGESTEYAYDKLIIATGASPVKPEIDGIDLENVFYMRTPEDAIALRELIDGGEVKKAVVVGAGYIGLEIAENIASQGVRPFVLDMAPHVLPGFDDEMADYIENKLIEEKIPVVTGVKVKAIEGDGKVEKVITDKRAYKTDLVVMSAGIKANTEFLNDTGIDMEKGVIVTNEYGCTSDPDIYAAGDCAMVRNAVTGNSQWSAMGSTANICGRIIAKNISGENISYKGVLGTAVCKLPGMNVGRTGLTEAQAKESGYDVVSVITVEDDKPQYMPGSGSFVIKMIADRKTQQLLGIQVAGPGNVDKVVDVAVTAIMLGGTLQVLAAADMSYAPPFSTAISPFSTTVNVLMNKICGDFETVTPKEYLEGKAADYKIIDTCKVASIPGAPYVDVAEVDGPLEGIGTDEKLLIVCNRGRKAYLLQNRLKYFGYTNTRVLEGGIAFNEVTVE